MTPPRTRRRMAVLILTIMISPYTYSQYFSSSRLFALGAATTFSDDINSIDWNPAGLVHVNDWELTSTSFYTFHNSDRSLSFQSLGIGRQLTHDQSLAFRVSPGISAEFIVPSSIVIRDSTQIFTTTFDKKIDYNERLAVGYAIKLNDMVSAGTSIHYIDENITDTKYTVDTNNIIHASEADYAHSVLTLDAGGTYSASPVLQVAAVVRNLLHVNPTSSIPDDEEQYALNTPAILRVGLGYTGIRALHLGFDADTKRQMRFGIEWEPTNVIRLQSGVYVDASSSSPLDAMTFGFDTKFDRVQFDLGYLVFLSQSNRQGSADVKVFQESGIHSVEYNPFSSDRVSLTASVNFSTGRQPLTQIEYVEVQHEIFPPMRRNFALQPIGKARVRNISATAVSTTVSLYISRFMDNPTQSTPVVISPGMAVDVPLYAVFNDEMKSLSSFVVREVEVTAQTVHEDDDRYQARILIHGKNDWNGDVSVLKYFVSPDDESVIRFTRTTLVGHKPELDSTGDALQHVTKAKILFDDFAKRVVYVDDPRKSEDVVQYPSETLSLNGGDCDDMSVCYASLLSSIGIPVAFIDVKPTDHPADAHVYLMFDTGMSPKDARYVSDNPKRYVIRKNEKNKESVWIPVETTAIKNGFTEAWNIGAKEYYDDAEVHLGILKGWVRIFDVQPMN